MNYKDVMPQHHAIAEVNHFNWCAQEKDLVKWWLHQAEHTENLRTIDDECLIILDSGHRNDGPGPDILRSRIILDDFEMSGDVEMHIVAGDWYAHGHQNDERYHNVILHVIVTGDAGPDIPTLKVMRACLGASQCHSIRPVTSAELIDHALHRFKRKAKHLQILAKEGQGNSPLFLGMIEIIMAGGSRFQSLQKAAGALGLNYWPDCRAWEGSNLVYPSSASKLHQLNRIIQASHLFRPDYWLSFSQDGWSERFIELQNLGLSWNQCLEFQVNILAPFLGVERGFIIWQRMKIFRHYGLEKKMLQQLGMPSIQGVVEQQGLLEWKKIYCSKGSCSNCPLIQYHHALTHIN